MWLNEISGCRTRFTTCSFRQIRPLMDRSMAIAVASAFVSARLDYANSILFGCPQKHISRLQPVQHARARVVKQHAYRSYSSTELLKQLHWLPIEWRIRFKLATSTYKTLHTGHPPYLTDLPQYHKSSVSTRSSTSQLLEIPCHNLSFGSRSFRVSAPKIWNSLTPQIRQCQTLATFRRPTTFSQPFLPPSVHHPMRPDSFWDFGALWIIYLLTYFLIVQRCFRKICKNSVKPWCRQV